MWKKALWIYLGLYVLGVLYVIISSSIRMVQAGELTLDIPILSSLFVLPGVIIALKICGKKVSIIFTLIALLIVAAPVAGIFKFNTLSVETIGKALLFLPMIVGLIYFGFGRKSEKIG